MSGIRSRRCHKGTRLTTIIMKIILASPRGFCAGVNMAIETLEQVLKLFGAPVYVYHEIVHNKHVVERFQGQGAVFVDDLREVPEDARLLFSAHGVSPEVRQIAQRAAAENDRRHLPAGHESAFGGGAVCQARLQDRADRPRGARRSDRHDGGSAGCVCAGGFDRGSRSAHICRRARSWRI